VPGRVFTETERRRLGAFPSEISEPDLIRYFTLSVSNLEFVRQQRGDHNRLGFALQLCALRYLGFCPDDIATTPSAAIAFVSDQLQVAPEALHAYGARPQTRTGHGVWGATEQKTCLTGRPIRTLLSDNMLQDSHVLRKLLSFGD